MIGTKAAPQRPRYNVAEWLSGVGSGPAGVPAAPSEAEAGIPAAALSSGQISPQQQELEAEIQYAKGGNFCKLKVKGLGQVGGGKRNAIRGFSAKSRRAMLEVVNSIDQTRCQASDFAFVTLTYPKEFPSAAASKPHLDQFIKRFERHWGGRWLIWKLEPQKRGAPHYHLLVYMGAGFDPANLSAWVAQAWHEIAGAGDSHHLRWHRGELGNRPCVEAVKDWKGVAAYAGKYLGKTTDGDEEWQHPGRYWGERRNELAPITIITEEIPYRIAVKCKRVIVRLYEKQRTGWYYVSGKKTASGKHKPGYRKHAREWAPGGDLSLLTARTIEYLAQELEREIRPQFRRWRGRRGGCSLFMRASEAERLLAFCIASFTPHPTRKNGTKSQKPGPLVGPTAIRSTWTPTHPASLVRNQ